MAGLETGYRAQSDDQLLELMEIGLEIDLMRFIAVFVVVDTLHENTNRDAAFLVVVVRALLMLERIFPDLAQWRKLTRASSSC